MSSLTRLLHTVRLVLLTAAAAAVVTPVAAAPGLWTVSIDEAPAPPPAAGPPFSAGASRDLSLLKYQIPGVVGGYVGVVLIIAIFLFTICRRRRLEAQASRSRLALKLVKPMKNTLDPSPLSPSASSMLSWKSLVRRGRSPRAEEFASPRTKSLASFDETVIEADKLKRQEEMERLYAAVLTQDPKSPKSPKSPVVQERQIRPTAEQQEQGHKRTPSNSSRNFSRRQPPPALDPASAQQAYAQEPTTPRSPVRAIYPPWEQPGAANINAAAESIYAGHPMAQSQRSLPASPRSLHSQSYPSLPASPRSIASQQGRSGSANSARSKNAPSIRTLPISPPIPQQRQEYYEDSRAPFAQRGQYPQHVPATPASPPPMSPGRPETPIEDDDYIGGLDGAADDDYYTYQQDDDYDIEAGAGDTDEDESDRIVRSYSDRRPFRTPRSQRQHEQDSRPPMSPRGASYESQKSQSSASGVGSLPLRAQYAPQPPPPAITSTSPPPNTLPLRQNHPQPLPLRVQQLHPLSPTRLNYASPTPTKTTFLSPRTDAFGSVLHTGTIPRTAGLSVPYSPYMPKTPVTPVTPHLTTRAERKQREREVGRRVPTAIDEVLAEEDMFGSAY